MTKYELSQYEFVKVRVDHKPYKSSHGRVILMKCAKGVFVKESKSEIVKIKGEKAKKNKYAGDG